jgi:hypothetical protein
MPGTGWTPSIVPKGDDQNINVYLVVDDLGWMGRVYLETDVETADLEKSLEGKVRHPVFKGLREDL